MKQKEVKETDEAFKHFGIDIQKMKEQRKEMKFILYRKDDIAQDIRNATGFKVKGRQKITIYCDDGYENILITEQKMA
ncbi:MAG: hypothetical protein NC293_12545 [Roseburia sp.]|nr:hypothetical protein [Roseburia sp.]